MTRAIEAEVATNRASRYLGVRIVDEAVETHGDDGIGGRRDGEGGKVVVDVRDAHEM